MEPVRPSNREQGYLPARTDVHLSEVVVHAGQDGGDHDAWALQQHLAARAGVHTNT